MKRLLFWGRLLLGIGLLAWLLYTTDFDELGSAIKRASPLLLVVAYLIGVVDRVLMAYKWNLLLRAQEISISLYNATVTYLTSTFLGLFLPATVGGDAVRAFAVAKFGYSAADVTSTIVLERALGILALIFMVVASIIVGSILVGASYFSDLQTVLLVVGSVGLVGLLLISLSFSAWFRQSLKRWLNITLGDLFGGLFGSLASSASNESKQGSKLTRFLTDFGKSYSQFQHKKSLLVLFFGLSLLENLFPIAWSYILATAFQLQVSLLDCFVVVPSVLILRRLPISIDGIGIHQTAFVYLLSLTGVPEAQGFLLGVVTHLLATLLVLPGGLFYMLTGFEMRPEERKSSV